MERAQADVIRARFHELDVALHHVHDVYTIEQVLLERVRDHKQGITPLFIPKACF